MVNDAFDDFSPPILIGIGANLPSARYGSPAQTVQAALRALAACDGVRVVACSRWFESAPVPLCDQPWYVNGVCHVQTDLGARALLDILHRIEAQFGRVRGQKNAARVLDLDLLAYGDFITAPDDDYTVPHARLQERAFVLLPLGDVAPNWVDPRSQTPLQDLIAALPQGQSIRPLAPSAGARDGN